ncbi:MAG: hypothetical protein WAT39_24050 [Planctomycetota bacterium]
MRTAREFASMAEAQAGVARWRKYGRDPSVGFDCGGFLLWLLAATGHDVDALMRSRAHDVAMPDPAWVRGLCDRFGDLVPPTDNGEGRVGLCAFGTVEPRHLVVMLADRRIAHADAQARGVVAVPSSWLDDRLVATYRVRGLEYGAPWQP